MAVPSTMSDLNVSAGSNSPGDTEQVFPENDNFLRSIQAILRRKDAKGTTLSSAATVNIGASVTGDFIDISGTTTITAFDTIDAGIERVVRFTDILTLTHSANLILPNGANIVTKANDVSTWRSLGGGVWICTGYSASALLNQQNTFNQKQTIAVTVNDPLTMSRTSGAVACTLVSLGGNGNSAYQAFADGTGNAGLYAYTQSPLTYRGGIFLTADSTMRIEGLGGNPIYTVNSAKVHNFLGSAGSGVFIFGDDDLSASITMSVSDGSFGDITTSEPVMAIGGQSNTLLATYSGGERDHYSVNSSGQHFSDASTYNGVVYPKVDCRGIGGCDTNGANSWVSQGVTFQRNSANNYTAYNTMPVGIGTNYHFSATAIESAANDVYICKILAKSPGLITYAFSDDDGIVPANDIAHTFSFHW